MSSWPETPTGGPSWTRGCRNRRTRFSRRPKNALDRKTNRRRSSSPTDISTTWAPSSISQRHGMFPSMPTNRNCLISPAEPATRNRIPPWRGGWVAKLSLLFPRDPVNLEDRVRKLPPDGRVPGMPGWRWIPTPGHTPGHVSLFREADRSLIAGDAFVTVRQDSLYKVVMQRKEISGPPRYWTTDWPSARESVKRLHALNPS